MVRRTQRPVFATVVGIFCRCVADHRLFQLKIKKQDLYSGRTKNSRGYSEMFENGEPSFVLRCKNLYPVYIADSFEKLFRITRDELQTDINVFPERIGSGKDWNVWKQYQSWDGKVPLRQNFI